MRFISRLAEQEWGAAALAELRKLMRQDIELSDAWADAAKSEQWLRHQLFPVQSTSSALVYFPAPTEGHWEALHQAELRSMEAQEAREAHWTQFGNYIDSLRRRMNLS